MTIGKRIRRRREELGLTQDDLAKIMGYSGRSAISVVELDKRDITWENVCKYAKALQCSPSYLMKKVITAFYFRRVPLLLILRFLTKK